MFPLPPFGRDACTSYHDRESLVQEADSYEVTRGFRNLYALRDGPGARFVDLLDAVSRCGLTCGGADGELWSLEHGSPRFVV